MSEGREKVLGIPKQAPEERHISRKESIGSPKASSIGATCTIGDYQI